MAKKRRVFLTIGLLVDPDAGNVRDQAYGIAEYAAEVLDGESNPSVQIVGWCAKKDSHPHFDRSWWHNRFKEAGDDAISEEK